MNKCAFLSMGILDAFECYDHLLIEPFNNCGWEVDTVSWRDETINWNLYGAVIIRSCWDYQQNASHFLETLCRIDKSSALLLNSFNLVQWNINKKYLIALSEKDVSVVSTILRESFTPDDLPAYFSALETDEIIIKPTIGANADNVFRLQREDAEDFRSGLEKAFHGASFLVQPFVENILSEGEYSLFYFNGTFSHAILKTPESGDFRAQEEHGGRLQSIKAEARLLKLADQTMKALPEEPLYARVDFVRDEASFLLMEVELIEPSLYFNMDAKSPLRFVEAFDSRWKDSQKIGI